MDPDPLDRGGRAQPRGPAGGAPSTDRCRRRSGRTTYSTSPRWTPRATSSSSWKRWMDPRVGELHTGRRHRRGRDLGPPHREDEIDLGRRRRRGRGPGLRVGEHHTWRRRRRGRTGESRRERGHRGGGEIDEPVCCVMGGKGG
jgi:hypothetical protein